MNRAPVWVERLARVGIVAKAIVYLAIGGLATAVALRVGGVLTGGEGVLQILVGQPLGRVGLAVLAFGFAAYTLWLFAQAVVDPDRNGTTFVGVVNRVGQIITGIAHIALTWEAVRLALGLPGGRDAGVEGLAGSVMEACAAAALDPEEAGGVGDVLARVWSQPFSHWLLGGVPLASCRSGCSP